MREYKYIIRFVNRIFEIRILNKIINLIITKDYIVKVFITKLLTNT